MMKYFLDWLDDRSGVTGMEYGILTGGISIAIVASVFLGGESISNVFATINNYMSRNL